MRKSFLLISVITLVSLHQVKTMAMEVPGVSETSLMLADTSSTSSTEISRHELKTQARHYLNSYKMRLSSLKHSVSRLHSFVEENAGTLPQCSTNIGSIELGYSEEIMNQEKKFYRRRDRYESEEARAKYIREMNPIPNKSTAHLELLESQIESIVKEEKKLVSDWTAHAYELKQKEKALKDELEGMEKLKERMKARNSDLDDKIIDYSTKNERLRSKFDDHKEKMDDLFSSLVASKGFDPTKGNGLFKTQQKCQEQVVEIVEVIADKKSYIRKRVKRKMKFYRRFIRKRIKKLHKQIKILEIVITELIEERNIIILKRLDIVKADRLAEIRKQIKKTKKKIIKLLRKEGKLMKRIKYKTGIVLNTILIRNLKKRNRSMMDADKRDKVLRRLERLGRHFKIKKRRRITLSDVTNHKGPKRRKKSHSLFRVAKKRQQKKKHSLFFRVLKKKKIKKKKRSLFSSARKRKKRKHHSLFSTASKKKKKRKLKKSFFKRSLLKKKKLRIRKLHFKLHHFKRRKKKGTLMKLLFSHHHKKKRAKKVKKKKKKSHDLFSRLMKKKRRRKKKMALLRRKHRLRHHHHSLLFSTHKKKHLLFRKKKKKKVVKKVKKKKKRRRRHHHHHRKLENCLLFDFC